MLITGNAALTVTAPAQPPQNATVSISSVPYTTEGGKNSDKHMTVSVTMVDGQGGPVSGAAVSITLSNDDDGSWVGSATSGEAGIVTFTLKNAPASCYTEVLVITHASLDWDGVTPDSTPSDPFCKGGASNGNSGF